jgi:hypothetical protein
MATVVDEFADLHLFEPEYGGLAESQRFGTEDETPAAAVEPQADGVPFSQKSFGERAQSLLANRERYKDSAAQRSASIAWATLEQSAATDRQTAAIERQTEVLAQQARIQTAQFEELRKQNQLTFYSMSPSDFDPKYAVEPEAREGEVNRGSIFMQIKRSLGIAPPLAKATVIEEEAEVTPDAAPLDTYELPTGA